MLQIFLTGMENRMRHCWILSEHRTMTMTYNDGDQTRVIILNKSCNNTAYRVGEA